MASATSPAKCRKRKLPDAWDESADPQRRENSLVARGRTQTQTRERASDRELRSADARSARPPRQPLRPQPAPPGEPAERRSRVHRSLPLHDRIRSRESATDLPATRTSPLLVSAPRATPQDTDPFAGPSSAYQSSRTSAERTVSTVSATAWSCAYRFHPRHTTCG